MLRMIRHREPLAADSLSGSCPGTGALLPTAPYCDVVPSRCLALVFVALAVASCGATAEPTTTTLPPARTTTTVGGVAELLQFTAPLVGGATFDAATLAGMPTVFWFWAPT